MDADLPATRRELDMLRERVEAIDAGGTRGMNALAVQVSELIKDVGKLEQRVEQQFTALEERVDQQFGTHRLEHRDDAARRAQGRRWVIGLAVAIIAAVDGPMVTILLSRH